eukprot:COSAG01_NODE_68_length_28978_cov_182.027777_34_plen_218_part_00
MEQCQRWTKAFAGATAQAASWRDGQYAHSALFGTRGTLGGADGSSGSGEAAAQRGGAPSSTSTGSRREVEEEEAAAAAREQQRRAVEELEVRRHDPPHEHGPSLRYDAGQPPSRRRQDAAQHAVSAGVSGNAALSVGRRGRGGARGGRGGGGGARRAAQPRPRARAPSRRGQAAPLRDHRSAAAEPRACAGALAHLGRGAAVDGCGGRCVLFGGRFD